MKAAPKTYSKTENRADAVLNGVAHVLFYSLLVLPQFAHAQSATAGLSGVTEFIRSIANLLIFEWGYLIGTITLAIQGYRWKTGRIDLLQLGGWGLGIGLVFFAPNIVKQIKSSSAGSV
jgi:type IV secretion system protein VirB2